MQRATAKIEGLAPYSASRKTDDIPMKDRESHDDYERRIWRDKVTVNGDGVVCIPAMAWKQALDTCAFKLGVKVPGRRGSTYKSFFTSGFFCEADAPIRVNGKWLKKDDAECVTISANADGVRGSGKRVPRSFPSFAKWETEVVFVITDDIIASDIFEQHLKSAGIIVGVGRFRAEKGGTNGRFRVVGVTWEDFRL